MEKHQKEALESLIEPLEDVKCLNEMAAAAIAHIGYKEGNDACFSIEHALRKQQTIIELTLATIQETVFGKRG